jgi:hypothetical protein
MLNELPRRQTLDKQSVSKFRNSGTRSVSRRHTAPMEGMSSDMLTWLLCDAMTSYRSGGECPATCVDGVLLGDSSVNAWACNSETSVT